MTTMKTIAQQVETFGTFLQRTETNEYPRDKYRMDNSTIAIIERDKHGNPMFIMFKYGID